MAQHGGKRPGAGRPKRTRLELAAQDRAGMRELARSHSQTAIATLAAIAAEGKSEAARIAAATALLDRGYGRPGAMIELADCEVAGAPAREVPSDLELARAVAFILAKARPQQT